MVLQCSFKVKPQYAIGIRDLLFGFDEDLFASCEYYLDTSNLTEPGHAVMPADHAVNSSLLQVFKVGGQCFSR